MRGRTSLAPLLVTSALCGASAFASVLRPSLQAFSRLRVGTSHYSGEGSQLCLMPALCAAFARPISARLPLPLNPHVRNARSLENEGASNGWERVRHPGCVHGQSLQPADVGAAAAHQPSILGPHLIVLCSQLASHPSGKLPHLPPALSRKLSRI